MEEEGNENILSQTSEYIYKVVKEKIEYVSDREPLKSFGAEMLQECE